MIRETRPRKPGARPRFWHPRDVRQKRILDWALSVFGAQTAGDPGERARRFLEESLELSQAAGLTRKQAQDLLQYVYDRPPGGIATEIAQVGVTLLALSEVHGVSAEGAEVREVERITALSTEHWRARQASKCARGVARPAGPPAPPLWTRSSWRRWTRLDGAVVLWDDRSPHPNPEIPTSLMWTAWEPDPSQQYLARGNGTFTWPRRWKTAEAAMREVDRQFPYTPKGGV